MKMNMKKIKNKSRIVSVLLTSVMCLNFVGCAEKQELHTKTGTAMGTVVNLQTYTSNKEMNQEIYDLITSLEEHTLSYRLTQSEVARINSQAGRDEGIAVSDKLYQDLITTFEVSGKSEGALDVTLGSVTKLWNIDNTLHSNIICRITDDTKIGDNIFNFSSLIKILATNNLIRNIFHH